MKLKHPITDQPSSSIYVLGVIAAAATTLTLLVSLWPRNPSGSPLDDDGAELVLKGYSEEQLRRMRDGPRTTVMEWAAEYSELPEDLRPVYLDKVIDEEQGQMQRRGRVHADLRERPASGSANARETVPKKLSAADRARLAEFSQALTERCREREIEVPAAIIEVSGPRRRPLPEPGT